LAINNEPGWEGKRYASLFDAWEVANRDDLFNAVGLKK
jgi:hypothetical protein